MKKRLLYLIRFYLLTVLIFMAAKWAFMICNHAEGTFSVGDMFAVLWHGLSLDLSTALYFLILPFLITMVSIWVRIPKWLMRPYYALVALAFALAFVSDTSMYAFWHFKLDFSWLQYLESPNEVMASVSVGYMIIRVIVLVISTIVFFFAYDRLAGVPASSRGNWKELILYVVTAPLMVIGIRGGFGDATTNTGQVYYSQNQFLNHSAVNPIFCFFYSMSHQLEDLSQYQFFEPEECEELLQGVYTTESLHQDTLLTTERPDILIILLESAGEQFASVMPHLQELKKEGIYFSQCFANSWRTDRGTLCVLSGYPSFPAISIMKTPEKSGFLPSIAGRLKEKGYQTSYLYGGDANFTNMRSYLFSTGWDQLTDIKDFSFKEQQTGQWGVRDDITFQRIYNQMIQSSPDVPHLWGYSTLSSHEPWEVPVKKLDDEVDNAFCYLDDCIDDFIKKLKQTPRWDNMLIVMIADHGIIHGEIDQTKPLQKNHIPMLWVGGAIREPRVIDRLCNQSDLAATLFGQLHLNHDDFIFSRDVLSESYTLPTVVNNYSNAQWIYNATGQQLYDFDLKRPLINECEDAQQMTRLNKAIIQQTTTDLQNR